MAQYGIGYYGKTGYGVVGASSGKFVSEEISTDFALGSGIKFKTVATDPICIYPYSDSIFFFDEQWAQDGDANTASADGAKVVIYLACSGISLSYSGSASYDVSMLDTSAGEYVSAGMSGSLPSFGVEGLHELPISSFMQYQITITANSGFSLHSASVYVGGTEVYIKCGDTQEGFYSASFAKLSMSTLSRTDGQRTTEFDASSLQGKRFYQFDVRVYCSDNETDIYLSDATVTTESQDVFAEYARYSEVVDMGVDFDKYTTIEWTSAVPDGTSLSIQTATSQTGVAWGVLSHTYEQGGVNIRLLPDQNTGYFITPEMDIDWLTKIYDTSFKVHMAAGASSNNTVDYYMIIDGSERPLKYNYTNNAVNIDTINPFRVKCVLGRRHGEFSPSVASIKFLTHCHYVETVTPSLDEDKTYVSSVEDRKDIINISQVGLNKPSYANNPRYTIKYASSTALPYILYFKSTSGISRSAVVNTGTDDTIVAECKNPVYISVRPVKIYINPTGDDHEIYMYNSFQNPHTNGSNTVLESGRQYLYRICNGVATVTYVDGMYRLSVQQGTSSPAISTAFKSKGWSATDKDYTSVSMINGSKDEDGNPIDDSILIEDTDPIVIDEVLWKSEEIIGSCQVNTNGIKIDTVEDYVTLPRIDGGIYLDDSDITSVFEPSSSVKIGPYTIEILPNSVVCVPKDGSEIPAQKERIKITSIEFNTPNIRDDEDNIISDYIMIDAIVRGEKSLPDGTAPDYDEMHNAFIKAVNFIGIWDNVLEYQSGIPSQYTEGTDYYFNEDTNRVVWTSSNRPDVDETYYAVYARTAPDYAIIKFECEYFNDIVEYMAWRSSKTKSIDGECSPGYDFVSQNLETLFPKNTAEWPDIPSVIDAESIVYDVEPSDNPYVKTYIKDNAVVGTLGGIIPSEHWLLKINSGYYYVGRDEYYMYSSAVEKTVTDGVPVILNCEYVPDGNYGGAVLSHDSMTNLIVDSNFKNVGIGNSYSPSLSSLM